jgi:hypothetical protein
MRKLLLLAFVFAACNNDKSESNTTDEMKKDQNRNTDTRNVDPTDTLNKMDTGNYDRMSDSIRNK